MNKKEFKKDGQELQDFLAFRKRGYWLKNKKGKGSYDRSKFKQSDFDEDENVLDYEEE